MWHSNRLAIFIGIPLLITSLLLPLASHANIPNSEVSGYFAGFSGNTGGSTFFGARYRTHWFEMGGFLGPLGLQVEATFRKLFNTDSFIIPYVSLGVAPMPLGFVSGVGMELLFLELLSGRQGIRIEQHAHIGFYQGVRINPEMAIGFSWHL